MTDEGVTDPLVVEHATADDLVTDAAVVVGPQQQAHVRDHAAVVDAHRDGVDVEDRQAVTGVVEVLAAQPRPRRLDFGHGLILPNAVRRLRQVRRGAGDPRVHTANESARAAPGGHRPADGHRPRQPRRRPGRCRGADRLDWRAQAFEPSSAASPGKKAHQQVEPGG